MGIVDRVTQLWNLDSTTDEQAETLVDAMKRLVEPAQMGTLYKVLVLTSPNMKQVKEELETVF
jgi:SAM-dependent MidA family methyltransferase